MVDCSSSGAFPTISGFQLSASDFRLRTFKPAFLFRRQHATSHGLLAPPARACFAFGLRHPCSKAIPSSSWTVRLALSVPSTFSRRSSFQSVRSSETEVSSDLSTFRRRGAFQSVRSSKAEASSNLSTFRSQSFFRSCGLMRFSPPGVYLEETLLSSRVTL